MELKKNINRSPSNVSTASSHSNETLEIYYFQAAWSLPPAPSSLPPPRLESLPNPQDLPPP